MGWYHPSDCFCDSTAPRPLLEASVSNRKGLPKSGKAKMGGGGASCGRCQWGILEGSIDELVTVQESIHLGPFQTEIIKGQVKPLLGSTLYMMITPLKVEGRPWKPNRFLWDSMSFMPTPASKMAVEGCLWWSETCLTATSSSRRACQWCGLCLQCWCHLRSCHQRWKPHYVRNLDRNPCWWQRGRKSCWRS